MFYKLFFYFKKKISVLEIYTFFPQFRSKPSKVMKKTCRNEGNSPKLREKSINF